MKRTMILVFALFIITGLMVAQDEANTIITQGQFAVKLTEILKAQTPEDAIDEQSAISFMESVGVAPVDGWNISASLTEGVLSQLVKVVGVQYSPIDANAYVTVAKANIILRRYSKMFRE